MAMKIGVTGTRNGLSKDQKEFANTALFNIPLGNPLEKYEFHHGNCIGVDVEVAAIARQYSYHIVCHPPMIKDLIGDFISDEYRPPLTYFQRNRNIVNETELLLAFPKEMERQAKGGTWYTVDYANKRNKAVIIIFPDGSTKGHNI